MSVHTWIGDDCPKGWRKVGTIDVADPANTRWAVDRGYRIGGIRDGGTDSVAEPCAADIYDKLEVGDRVELTTKGREQLAPKCGNRFGIIVGDRAATDCWRIQWDGMKGRRSISKGCIQREGIAQ